jgi:hypothetical protein
MPSVMPSVEGQHGQELAGAKGNGGSSAKVTLCL